MTCQRCDDTGLIELVGGTHRLVGALTRRGAIDTPHVEATPDRPVYKACSCRREPAQVIPIARRYGADDD